MILRTYRRLNALSLEKLAIILGDDKTYISIETGRRAVHDVASLRHIGRTLAIPAHLLGVTNSADTEFNAMIAFAESVTRLEARAAAGQLEQATLSVLGKAWVSLGVCLGTVLPEERLGLHTAAGTGRHDFGLPAEHCCR